MQYPRAYEKIPNIMTTWEDVNTDTENDKVGKRTKERVNQRRGGRSGEILPRKEWIVNILNRPTT